MVAPIVPQAVPAAPVPAPVAVPIPPTGALGPLTLRSEKINMRTQKCLVKAFEYPGCEFTYNSKSNTLELNRASLILSDSGALTHIRGAIIDFAKRELQAKAAAVALRGRDIRVVVIAIPDARQGHRGHGHGWG